MIYALFTVKKEWHHANKQGVYNVIENSWIGPFEDIEVAKEHAEAHTEMLLNTQSRAIISISGLRYTTSISSNPDKKVNPWNS